MFRCCQTTLCIAVAAMLAGAAPGAAQNSTLGKIGGAVQDAGNALKKGAQKTGKGPLPRVRRTPARRSRRVSSAPVTHYSARSRKKDDVSGPGSRRPDAPRYLFVQQARNADNQRRSADPVGPGRRRPTTLPTGRSAVPAISATATLRRCGEDESADSFRNDPPNAALTTPGQVDDDPIVLELLKR